MLSRPLSLVSITFLAYQKVFFPSVRANKVKRKKAYLKSLSKPRAAVFSLKTNFASLFTLKSPKGRYTFSSKNCTLMIASKINFLIFFLQLCSQYCIGNYVFQEAAFLETWEITLLDPLDLQQYRATVSYLCIELPMQACRASPLFDGDN